jgi:hypothetical protein
MKSFTQFLKESNSLNELSNQNLIDYVRRNMDEEEVKEALLWVVGSVLNTKQIKDLASEIKSSYGGNPTTAKAMVDYINKKIDAEDCDDFMNYAIQLLDNTQAKKAYDYISDLY